MNTAPELVLPSLGAAKVLNSGPSRCYIGAYGFEDRSLGWAKLQRNAADLIHGAYMFKYENSRALNKVEELRQSLVEMGITTDKIEEISYNVLCPHDIEDSYDAHLDEISKYDEVILDITAMTKFLILISLCKLSVLHNRIRIVYSEAMNYAPSRKDFQESKDDMTSQARFPNRGFGSIVRATCLNSIRMQGQPVTLIAFTSFNVQLIRHMLGTISPHRLVFINGRPPRQEFRWRERATQDIHRRLVEEFPNDNLIDSNGELIRTASTLHYVESIHRIDEVYQRYGMHERIMVAATGSKMQTVGLFFAKILHPDIHIEYPSPQSYLSKGMSTKVRAIHELVIEDFSALTSTFRAAFSGGSFTAGV